MSRSTSASGPDPSAIDRAIAEYLQARDTQPNFDHEEFLARYPIFAKNWWLLSTMI